MPTLERKVIGTQKTICHRIVNGLSLCLQGAGANRVPHPNVVLFDVRVGFHERGKVGIFAVAGPMQPSYFRGMSSGHCCAPCNTRKIRTVSLATR